MDTVYEICLNKDKLNDYQIGRINGMIHVLTGMPDHGYPIEENHNVCVMTFKGDADVMCRVRDAIEKTYPGVIVSEDD